jgi:hypothetical protein
MTNFPIRRGYSPLAPIDIYGAIRIVK